MARVAQNAASVQLLATENRTGFIVVNESTSDLRIKWGNVTSVSAIDYMVLIPASQTYESPFGVNVADGAVYGIWAGAGTGAAQVTSF